MRRKSRRRKSWFARLFSRKPRAQAESGGTLVRKPVLKFPVAAMPTAKSPALRRLPEEAVSLKAKAPTMLREPREPNEAPIVSAQPVRDWFASYSRKVGGGSLLVSVLIHLAVLIIASFIVTSVVARSGVDFLSGGGSKTGEAASEQLAQQVKTKRRLLLNKPVPLRRVVSSSTTSTIALPDLPMPTLDLPHLPAVLGGNMGSGGFASRGAGGGFGTGIGLGGMAGRSLKPIVMFGRNLNARSIAVILDVSGSMTSHLSKVLEELDRVAKRSPVVLYDGCGIAKPPKGLRLDQDAVETRRPAKFHPFWEEAHGPEMEVRSILESRPYTYFIKSQGIQYAWISLLNDQVRNAEALYWFSDFEDEVDDEQIASVLSNLKRRRQKLFMHASEKGNSYAKVRDQLCIPSGGAVIQAGN